MANEVDRQDLVEDSGFLVREAGGFVLTGDSGARWTLDLSRLPVDHVGKRVRIVGRRVNAGHLEVESIARA